jgi:hypothetical protein
MSDTNHAIAIGTPVRVTRNGVVQPWNTIVYRHDRNGTYRLRFPENDTFVTVHADEIAPLAHTADVGVSA